MVSAVLLRAAGSYSFLSVYATSINKNKQISVGVDQKLMLTDFGKASVQKSVSHAILCDSSFKLLREQS